MASTRTLIHEWTKTRPAQAGHNSKVLTMNKITFNTGREYATEGQIIHATKLDDERVHFVDVTRYLDGVVRCAFNERAILRAYDENDYNHYANFDEQMHLNQIARDMHNEHRAAK